MSERDGEPLRIMGQGTRVKKTLRALLPKYVEGKSIFYSKGGLDVE